MISAYIASFETSYSLEILSIYISCSILLSTVLTNFAISFRNFILSLTLSKFKSFFKTFTLNSISDIALSIRLLNLPFPNFLLFPTKDILISSDSGKEFCQMMTTILK